MGFTFLADRFVVVAFVGANPGAGNPYLLIPPAGCAYKVLAGRFVFTTDATVSTRIIRIDFTNAGGLAYGGTVGLITQAAGLIYEHVFMIGYQGEGYLVTNQATLHWPDNVWINPLHYLRIGPSGMGVGDTITDIRFTLEKTIDELA